MRVVYSFPHPLDRPGIAVTALNQVRGLAACGVEVTLFCTSVGEVELPDSVTVHQTMMVRGRRVPHRAVGVQRAYSYHDAVVARWLRRNPGAVDLVHAWPRGCLRTLQQAAALGIPGLRESPNPHTASVQRESARAVAHAGAPLGRGHSHSPDAAVLARERREYGAAAWILVPSDYAYQEFLNEGVAATSLLQHRYGCDLTRFPARSGPHAQDRPFTAAFVGRGDPTKGLHVGLTAWRRAAVPGGRFKIAGSIQEGYRARIADDLAADGVEEAGFVDDPSVLLREADVLILPSWTEGSALVVLEAQASGCIPLVSAASGATGDRGLDYVQHEVGDVDTLAEQIRELAQDAARRRELSARGTARRAELSWEAAARVLVQLYRDALAAQLPAPGRTDAPRGVRGRLALGARRRLRARFGIWVLYEARNKVLGMPGAIAGLLREDAEVRRLRHTTHVPPATVTTVMPTYRRPEALQRAVASALGQDWNDHTVIVVDDGGGLPDLPEDPRLVAVSLRSNTSRVSLVRNVGLRLARSPYVAFLDDDNEWRPQHLTVALEALEQGVDVVYTAVERARPDGRTHDVLSAPFDRRTLADASYVDTNSLVVRHGRGVRFSRLDRPRTMLPKEDWEFVWRLSRRHRTVHLPIPTVRYLMNPDSYYTTWGSGDELTAPDLGTTGVST
ncbi:glycosyltransferase [Actinotalea sp. C106]|uniref:glycosyltransferase n=1 Tax=Actinotalea sp. C106 TaxID=2908644 RepID=UPI0020282806|nr:glycosyltransferase [Actinotalea sp. C106]